MQQSWSNQNDRLKKSIEFSNFQEAMRFLNQVADIAEELQHHPDFRLHSYNKVEIEIYTHDVEKVTDKDQILAGHIDQLLS